MGGEIYIAVTLAAALVASLAHFERADRKARANARARLGLEAHGDVIEVPAEAIRAGGNSSGGDGSKTHRLGTQHKDGLSNAALRKAV